MAFLDSSIIIYTIDPGDSRYTKSVALLSQRPAISVQVINECVHVYRRRFNASPEAAKTLVEDLLSLCAVLPLTEKDIRLAAELAVVIIFLIGTLLAWLMRSITAEVFSTLRIFNTEWC